MSLSPSILPSSVRAAPKQVLQTIGFLLLNEYSLIALASALEPLRMANRLCQKPLYRWYTLGFEEEVVASNGLCTRPEYLLKAPLIDAHFIAPLPDIIFVCAGIRPHQHKKNVYLSKFLRHLNQKNIALGSLCTGTSALAEAGVLDGYRCTVHWENAEVCAEAYPELDITATLFEIDDKRYTCAGGTAGLDMMVDIITREHGEALGKRVAAQMLYNPRQPYEHIKPSLERQLGIQNPKVLACTAYMHAHIERPLGMNALAHNVGLSVRQLERLFRSELHDTPTHYYMGIRLMHARQILLQTDLPIVHIAVACGFGSASHFTKAYKAHFHYPPIKERQHGRNKDYV